MWGFPGCEAVYSMRTLNRFFIHQCWSCPKSTQSLKFSVMIDNSCRKHVVFGLVAAVPDFAAYFFCSICAEMFFWCWWLYAFSDKTANCLTNKMYLSLLFQLTILFFLWSLIPLALLRPVMLSQTLLLGRILCWVAISYLILLFTETSLFLLFPPPPRPAPLLLPGPALDPVWRSYHLVRQLLVRLPFKAPLS